jgi:hypothetical protein
MKGLLHRLAARAAGSAIAVRSDARLGFADSRAQVATAEPGLDQSLAIGDAASTSSAPEASTAALQIAPAPAPLVSASLPPISAYRAVSAEVAGEVRAGHTDPSSGMLEARVPPLLVQSGPASDVHVSSRHIESGTRSQDRASNQESAPAQRSERIPAPAREPALLLPEVAATFSPRPALLAPTTTRATTGSMHAVPHDQPNEVHVHIGRIEVTAVHQAASPRYRATPTNPPMSLDAYLAKRGRT